MAGKLYLIPTLIGETEVEQVIPAHICTLINSIRTYIVENERTARRMLLRMGMETAVDDVQFLLLNKYTPASAIPEYLDKLQDGDVGLLSEAGVPAIADPGSNIVQMAHAKNLEVVPLVGPSSILLAMMASGMNGQNFAFVGYLPVKGNDRAQRIRQLENRSLIENQSQIFIEAPYRNNQLLKDLLTYCSATTRVCVACNLTAEDGWVKTLTVQQWKKKLPELHKIPTIFVLHKDK
ncbi:MAG: SAM-dependent methyltransferase [Bacteroidales bacterium]|nr:SAM-dependent methyltransferase [Bacteroidales bacterium]